MFYENGTERKARVAILDRRDFKTKVIVRDKERHYIMRKSEIQQKI